MKYLVVLVSFLVVGVSQAEESNWSAGVGTGVVFFQGDEEFNSSVLFDTKLNYALSDHFSLQTSMGWMPFLRADSSAASNPNRWHLDDSQAARAALDLIYNVKPGREVGEWNSSLGITGGAMYYNNSLEDGGHWDAFVGAGAGLSYALSKKWDFRSDYRFLVEPDDRDLNHLAGMSLMYHLGRGGDDYSEVDENADYGALGENIGSSPGLKTIYFDYDKSALTEDSKTRLEANAMWLADNPEATLVLEGHCDERGTGDYNLALGQRRAERAREYLVNLGVEPERLKTVSYGEEVPAVSGSTEAAWAKNRRVECIEEN